MILLVAYKLIDFHHIRTTIKFSRSETSILFTAIFATLFLELEFAIYLGVLLSILFFLAKTSTPNIATLSVDTDVESGKRTFITIQKKPLKRCPRLKIIRIDIFIYFGSINHVLERISQIVENERIDHILIVASGVNFIDLASAEALLQENNRLRQKGGGLYFVGLKTSVYEFTAKTCFVKKIGWDHFFDSKTDAIRTIYRRLDRGVCKTCQSLLFKECQ